MAVMFHFSTKQREILELLVRGNPDGSFLDLDELIERLSYKPSKAAVQFSVRALVGHKMIQKKPRELRRNRIRVVLAPTLLGFQIIRGRSSLII